MYKGGRRRGGRREEGMEVGEGEDERRDGGGRGERCEERRWLVTEYIHYWQGQQ